MSLIQGGSHKVNTTAFYPKTIDQSLRFEDGDGAHLTISPSTADNRKIWTFSAWAKRGSGGFTIFSANIGGNTNETQIQFNPSNQIEIKQDISGLKLYAYTSAVFRDPSAWYHVVVAFDTTQATNTNGVKLYVNGVNQALTFTAYTQNTDFQFTSGGTGKIGNNHLNNYYDGYLAEIHFIDGTAYTADAFGELKSGIWVPKAPSVTYGTNGFHLDGSDITLSGSNITFVNDTSTNSNNFTANNLVASDVVPDSPTNNFAVLNPLEDNTGSSATLALREGNLRSHIQNNPGDHNISGTFAPTSGKWYWEQYVVSMYGSQYWAGISQANLYAVRNFEYGVGYRAGGVVRINGVDDSTGLTTYTTGDVVGIAVDMDGGTIDFYVNGSSSIYQATLPSSITDNGFKPNTANGTTGGDQVCFYNFGQDSTFAGTLTAGGNTDANGIGDFKHTVPSGYLALCTSNLPDPVFDPAQDATPEDHFNVITYSGTTSSPRTITGVGFEPDFVWVKNRTSAYSNILWNVVSGDDKVAITNTTASETATSGDANGIISTNDADGFVVKNGASSGLNVGSSGSFNYVAWNWKAGGTGVSNTDGSITSTVSANTDAGFSIVGWTGNGTDGATLGHGLTAASPELIIFKNRDVSNDWFVMGYPNNPVFTADGSNLRLNTTADLTDSTTAEISIGSSVVTFVDNIDDINGNGDEMIAYCFHSVDGYSKVGSYVGNGSADGTFVYTGFRPKFIMLKRANSTGGSWVMMDAEREPYNFVENYVVANTSAAEVTTASSTDCDFLSNGIKFRTNAASINASGDEIIYIAFAEQPVKYSNAR